MKIKLTFFSLLLACGLFAQTTNSEILLNAGFEEAKQTMFATEFSDWNNPLGAVTIETTDKQEGNQSMRYKLTTSPSGTLHQTLFTYPEYPTEGATYRMRIRYKVIKASEGQTFKINSYWNSKTDGELNKPGDPDRDKLLVEGLTKTDWTTKEIETTCPAGASTFEFKLEIPKNMEILFDDFSFTKTQTSEPTILVNYQPSKVETTINDTAYFSDLTIEYGHLQSDIDIYFTGANTNFFFTNTNSIAAKDVENGTETIHIGYAPTAVGFHKATLIIESAKHSILTKTFHFTASCIDTATPPTISIQPTSLPTFKCEAGKSTDAGITVTSTSCIMPIDIKVEHQENEGFVISNSQIPQNIEAKIDISFRPNAEGKYRSKVIFSSEKAQTVELLLEGEATASTAKPDSLTYSFNFDWTNATKLLNEHFDNADHNKTLNIDNWQNVVETGQRAWWGYQIKDPENPQLVIDHCAKATTYIYQHSSTSERGTMWLVTPTLDYKNAAGKTLTMRVMADKMFENHNTKFSAWLIDSLPSDKNIVFRELQNIGIPATPDLNNEWSELHINLEGQDIADVFAVGFKYEGTIGEANAISYYVDDVSWGRTDLPVLSHDSTKIEMIAGISTKKTSGAITVTGKNLTQDIKLKVGGANPSNFKLSTDILPVEGGQFAVTFESDKEGVHEAYIKISSRGAADTYIPMAVLCKKNITAVENITLPEVKTWTSNGTIYITSPTVLDIVIYSINGQIIKQLNNCHNATITNLNAGSYIINITTDNGTTENRKVSL